MAEPVRTSFNRLDYIFKLSVILTLAVVATILAKDILIPLLFSGLLSMVMVPLVRRLERRGLNRTLSVSIVLAVALLILGAIIWITIGQVVDLVNDLPNLEAKFNSLVTQLQAAAVENLGMTGEEANRAHRRSFEKSRSDPWRYPYQNR
jgi:predicted PurR-regulated permease PerM